MRQLLIAAAAVALLGLGAGQTQAGKVEIKNVHICCGQCQKAIGGLLAKVDGVSEPMCDQKTKIVTFSAKDNKAATAGLKALLDAGFFGAATEDGKEIKVAVFEAKKGEKADEITIKSVHVCCGQCQKVITALYKENKVEFPEKGHVKISGKGLDKASVMETLRKAGFNGTIEK